ncbi:hypothetical protein GH714_043984 [Hevea brasiliensis]|uniref:Uncharacterized protein n=1 Tax=Hevea brasiliensis TaxID=3981 RepID=A0A6A6K198_HEVBR|nr:hypothetical protein GH714_043984 [Hevea brasiliensis]
MHGRTSREALRGLLCIGVPLSGRDLAWDMKTSLEGIAWHGLREACMSWHGKGGRKLHGQLERVHVKLAFAWHEWDVKLSQMKFTWAMQFEDQVLRQNEKHMGLVEDMWRLEWVTLGDLNLDGKLGCREVHLVFEGTIAVSLVLSLGLLCVRAFGLRSVRQKWLKQVTSKEVLLWGTAGWCEDHEVGQICVLSFVERELGNVKTRLDELVSENEVQKTVHAEEMSTLREDNHVLKEEVERLKGEMEEMRGKFVLLARLVARKCGTNPHSTISITTPGASKSEGSVRENFHSWEKDRRGSRHVLKCYRCRGPHKKRDCPKKAVFLAKGKEPKIFFTTGASKQWKLDV